MADLSAITLPNNQNYNLKDSRVDLKSSTRATYSSETLTNTSGRQYAVTPDKDGKMSVNVPWESISAITAAEIDAICV